MTNLQVKHRVMGACWALLGVTSAWATETVSLSQGAPSQGGKIIVANEPVAQVMVQGALHYPLLAGLVLVGGIALVIYFLRQRRSDDQTPHQPEPPAVPSAWPKSFKPASATGHFPRGGVAGVADQVVPTAKAAPKVAGTFPKKPPEAATGTTTGSADADRARAREALDFTRSAKPDATALSQANAEKSARPANTASPSAKDKPIRAANDEPARGNAAGNDSGFDWPGVGESVHTVHATTNKVAKAAPPAPRADGGLPVLDFAFDEDSAKPAQPAADAAANISTPSTMAPKAKERPAIALNSLQLRLRDRYISVRFPGVAKSSQDLEASVQVIKAARLYFEDDSPRHAVELLELALEQHPEEEPLWLALIEILFLVRLRNEFCRAAARFKVQHPHSGQWPEVARLGAVIAGDHILFRSTVGGPRAHEHYGPWPDLPNWIQAPWDLTAEVAAADFHSRMNQRLASRKAPPTPLARAA